MRIGIDLMGGDQPPYLFFNAILQAAETLPLPHAILVVIAAQSVVDQLSAFIKPSENAHVSNHIRFQVAADTISMTDNPLGAVRLKKESSLVVGMRMLKKKQIDALVSCGNTGALVAAATLYLPMLTGIVRPALLAALPSERGPVAVLDVGGNVSCKARNLVQFAFLGAAYQRAVHRIEVPTIGLLNVGVESKKGTAEVCQAYEFLKNHCQNLAAHGMAPRLRFAGNVEGRDLFKGVVDVLVTDGFSGNVLLKTAEGVAAFIFNTLSASAKEGAPLSFQNAFAHLEHRFNYDEYPGAIVCGVDGIVMKMHGNASSKTLLTTVAAAADFIQRDAIRLIKEQLQG